MSHMLTYRSLGESTLYVIHYFLRCSKVLTE